MQPECLIGKKIKLLEMEIYYLILELSNLLDMTFESRDERGPIILFNSSTFVVDESV